MHSYIYCSIIHNRQDMGTIQMAINGRMAKKYVVPVYNEILFSHEKGVHPAIFYNVSGPEAHYSNKR